MLKTFVYGSCVSRDLTEIFRSEMECKNYIARQSWISATSAGLAAIGTTELTSPFQQNMLNGDLTSSALVALEASLPESDVILLDIIDDRFGVYPLEGSYITPTAEFGSSGLRRSLTLGKHIPFGTDEHFELWTSSAKLMRQTIGDHADKAFLLGASFTSRAVDGSEVVSALEKNSFDWNKLYARYYRYARELGLQVVMLPDDLAVSTPYHKWGSAPFHYVEAAYGWWLDRIKESLAP